MVFRYIYLQFAIYLQPSAVYSNAQTCNVLELFLQRELNNVAKWSYESRMQTTISRTKSMLITTRLKLYTFNPTETLKFHIGNMPVESIVEHKVLGL